MIDCRAQKRFQDFLEEWKAEGSDDLKYLEEARELITPGRNTLQVHNPASLSGVHKIATSKW